MKDQRSPQVVLAQPFMLPNGSVVRNRLIKAAMSEALGTFRCQPTQMHEKLYGRWADGGIGLSITGNVMVDRRALGEPGNVVLEDEKELKLLRRWAQAGTRGGTQLWMQINHPGKQCPKGLNRETVSPSAVPFRPELQAMFATPRALTGLEVEEIITRFGEAARIAKKTGFTGVQIHGAHGYLVSQFLSPHHNIRTDKWGGTPKKRRNFVLSVLKEMRRQVGKDFPIGIKLNSADFQRGGFTEEESLDAICALAEAGIELIEISGGTYESPVMISTQKNLPQTSKETAMKESTVRREAYFLEFAEKARSAVKVPLMVTGGFKTARGMANAISSGAVDFVGIGRLLAIEPDLPLRLLSGQPGLTEIVPIRTGIKFVDRMGFMELAWYTRQIRRMGEGKDPRPHEPALQALVANVLNGGWRSLNTRLRS